MTWIVGCTITAIDNAASRMWLTWALGKGTCPSNGAFSWLLAHCDDGVVWGWLDIKRASWNLSSNAFPDMSPPVSETNLLELRLFGPTREVLIWRCDAGLRGRVLEDLEACAQTDPEWPARPATEERVLLGDRVISPAHDGFTPVGDGTGAQQAVPLICEKSDFNAGRWPLSLKVRHYFEINEVSGAIRVAATRLVEVSKEVK